MPLLPVFSLAVRAAWCPSETACPLLPCPPCAAVGLCPSGGSCGADAQCSCPSQECCSKFNHCGLAASQCGVGCQPLYGACSGKWDVSPYRQIDDQLPRPPPPLSPHSSFPSPSSSVLPPHSPLLTPHSPPPPPSSAYSNPSSLLMRPPKKKHTLRLISCHTHLALMG